MENKKVTEMISMEDALSVFVPQIDRLRMTVSVLEAKNNLLKKNLDGFISMNQSVQQELYCRACGSFFEGKVFMCTNGHNFCDRCHLLVNQCPGCQDDNPRANNAFMESLIGKVSYPCTYSREGCPAFFVQQDNQQRVDHERICGYKFSCKFFFQGNGNTDEPCNWNGKTSDFLFHCLEFHNNDIITSDNGCVIRITRQQNNILIPTHIKSFLLSTLGKMFIIRFLLQQEAGILVPHAFYVGEQEELNNYRVSYRFTRRDNEVIYTAAPLPCLRNTNVCDLLQAQHHISKHTMNMFTGPDGISCHVSVYRAE